MYGFRVQDPKLFLNTLVGTARVFGADKITEYFRGRTLACVASNIGAALVQKNISIVQIAMHLENLSEYCRERIAAEFTRYGLELVSFYFESINIPTDDSSYVKLKQIKEKSAELNIIGRDIYQYDKSMDVLKTAAGNEGAGSAVMQSGIGLGMGIAVGNQVGHQAGQMITKLTDGGKAAPPPAPQISSVLFHVALNGQQLGPFTLDVLEQMIPAGTLSSATLVWCQGMSAWQPASTVTELTQLFRAKASTPPPLQNRF